MDINQMVNDIFEQDQPKKKINTLKDIPLYDQTEFEANEFDTIYRTPPQVSEKDWVKIDDLRGTEALPKNYTVAENPEKYMDELEKTHPRRNIKFKLPGDYNKPENIPNEKITNPNKLPTRGLYSALLDEFVVQPPKSMSRRDQQNFYIDVMHEDTHQRQRRIEMNQPIPRVLTEPGVPLFEKMFYNKQISKDFRERLRNETAPFEERKQIMKDRQEVTKEIEDDSFTEQLAYYGDYFLQPALGNPKNETERALNRLKFKNAPIWGMNV